MSTKFSLGCKFDTPHRRLMYKSALGPKGLFTSTPALTSGITSVAEFEALTMDQGPTGACEGHSSAQALWMGFQAQGAPLPWTPSPDAIYRDARCYSRSTNSDGTLPPLTDSGCMTSDVLAVLPMLGVKGMNAPTSDGRNSDAEAGTINREPTLDELDTEQEDLVLIDPGAYAVNLSNTQEALAVIQSALAAKWVPRIDIICDTAFQNWFGSYSAQSSPVDYCNPKDPNAGGHAMIISEVNVTSSGIVLCGLNSWGNIGAPAFDSNCQNKTGHWVATANWFTTAAIQVTVFKCSRVPA